MEILRNTNGIVAIDIETMPNYNLEEDLIAEYVDSKMDKRLKDKDKINEKRKQIESKMALEPFTGKVFIIGVSNETSTVTLLNKEILTEEEFSNIDFNIYTNIFVYENEKKLLESFIFELNQALQNGNILITYNGKDFDIPFLMKRCLINKVESYITNYNKIVRRYPTSYHVDLYEILNNKLSANIKFILGENLVEIDVEKSIENRNIIEIIEKNRLDVEYTVKLYNSLKNWLSTNLEY